MGHELSFPLVVWLQAGKARLRHDFSQFSAKEVAPENEGLVMKMMSALAQQNDELEYCNIIKILYNMSNTNTHLDGDRASLHRRLAGDQVRYTLGTQSGARSGATVPAQGIGSSLSLLQRLSHRRRFLTFLESSFESGGGTDCPRAAQ
jgi:hypothetical protein